MKLVQIWQLGEDRNRGLSTTKTKAQPILENVEPLFWLMMLGLGNCRPFERRSCVKPLRLGYTRATNFAEGLHPRSASRNHWHFGPSLRVGGE